MAQQTPPFVIQASSHSAALFRQMLQATWMRTGIPDSLSFGVAAQATPNMTVLLQGGQSIIDGSQVSAIFGSTGLSTQGDYFGLNDAQVTLTIATSNSLPRIDVVYVAVNDAQYSGATNNVVLGVVTGTPNASPTVPALPNNAQSLAQVLVAANVSSITNGAITKTDGSSITGAAIVAGTMYPCTTTTRPAGPRVGQPIYETDTTQLRVQNASGAWQTFASTTLACTSTTRPSSPVAGMTVYETDTGLCKVYTGSAWATINVYSPPDTGWQSLTVNTAAGFAAGPTLTPRYRVYDNVAYVQIEVSGTWAANAVITTLPTAARPTSKPPFFTVPQYGNTQVPVEVFTNGQIKALAAGTSSGILCCVSYLLG